VLTVSIHGHPNFAYPYFSGFADERGAGPGLGANRNYPLEERVNGSNYREALARALRRVEKHGTEILVVALGLDTGRKDPTGTWELGSADFTANGRLVGGLRLPTLVVQEGGYRIRNLGVNARCFFTGLWETAFGLGARSPLGTKNSV
jgi:acetoin utilization deacetylase AcuC-like enzyme